MRWLYLKRFHKFYMRKIFLLLFIAITSIAANAQQLLQTDLRQIDVDKLSDDEIIYYYNRMQQAGVSLDQAMQIAASRGMSKDELDKLQKRIQQINSGQKSVTPGTKNSRPDSVTTSRSENQQKFSEQDEKYDKRIFGSDLFRSSSVSFEPNLRIATPANYVLGPDDELSINVYGNSETKYNLKVTPEGSIYIPNAGPVFVSGLTVEDATSKIKAKLAGTIYKAINTGNTKVQVNLGNIRSIRVTIIGEAKKPGSYTVSSLSTVFNALYLCGGPNNNGSYRAIELVRNNKVVSIIDIYSFLLKGSMAGNLRLMDQDVIRIPYYQSRVNIAGEIKRPGIFEINEGDKLLSIFSAAGGFTDSAYRNSVKITRLTDRERSVSDVLSDSFSSYTLRGGDSINIGKVLNRYTNRVKIDGAINRPGEFELSDGLTLKGLIEKADGLRKDAYLIRGLITRLKDNLDVEVVSFDPGAIMAGEQPDILLKKEDDISISSIKDLKDKFTFSVQGEVRKPGLYDFKDSTSIKDLVFAAGGFTEAATAKRIEVARRVTNADVNATSTEIAKIIQLDAEKDLSVSGGDFYLKPFDVVIVRNNPGYYTQRTVIVDGEVLYPGPYIINSNDERLSNIIERAGGFKNTADPSAASLKRLNLMSPQSEIKLRKIEKIAISQNSRDTSSADSLAKEGVRPYDLIGINLEEVLKTPGITNDLILENGDVVFVPKKNQAVKVRGEVLFPTQFAFQENKNMKYYIGKAGGFSSNAVKRKSFVLGTNGNARKVKSFLFIKTYPEIFGGDEIFVPKTPDKKGSGLSTAEIIGISTAVASLASVVIALLNITK